MSSRDDGDVRRRRASALRALGRLGAGGIDHVHAVVDALNDAKVRYYMYQYIYEILYISILYA